jgi:transglutaminase-like putative cysteine protease
MTPNNPISQPLPGQPASSPQLTILQRIGYFYRDTYHKLAVILAFILVFLWTTSMGEIWWEEIFPFASTVLFAVATIMLFVPLNWLSSLLQFGMMIFLYAKMVTDDVLEEMMESSVYDDVFPLRLMFISGGILVWLFMNMLVLMRKQRGSLLVLQTLVLLWMISIDSFGVELVLTKQILDYVIIMLVFLCCQHFFAFTTHFPHNARNLWKNAHRIVAPCAALLAVFLVLGLLLPNVIEPLKPILTDPYTKYFLQGEAMSLGASAGPTSGFREDDAELGGGFTADPTPVMRVKSAQATYMRGETKATYTGRGWEVGDAEEYLNARVGAVPDGDEILEGALLPNTSQIMDEARKTTLKQEVEMLDETWYSVLFAGDRVKQLTQVLGRADPKFRWEPFSEQMKLEGKDYPTAYTMVTEVTAINPDILRALGSTGGPYLTNKRANQNFEEAYLTVPDSVPDRVGELAEQITADAKTDYDKVKAIEQYLKANYPYTTNPKAPADPEGDFVDQFLFEVREGYCDYYSSAMAIMTRQIGMPTRWIKGFAAGNEEQEDTYLVTSAEAHSWVEVYFNEYGWVQFEPTGSFAAPFAPAEDELVVPPPLLPDPEDVPAEDVTGDEAEEENAAPDEDSRAEEQAADEEQVEDEIASGTEEADSADHSGIWRVLGIVLGSILLMVILVLVALRFPRTRRMVLLVAAKLHLTEIIGRTSPKEALLLRAQRLMHSVTVDGSRVEDYETFREVMFRLFAPRLMQADLAELETLIRTFEMAQYGNAEVTAADVQRFDQRANYVQNAAKHGTMG